MNRKECLSLRDFQIQADEEIDVPLSRDGDTWTARCTKGVIASGTPYRVVISKGNGELLYRRDPYAHQTDYNSSWCYADNPALFDWSDSGEGSDAYPRTYPPAFDEYVIYELHVGSFTPEGTFRGAAERLEHVAELGFTAIQLMPIAEFADAWGYNPRQLLSVHGPYGSPSDLRSLIDKAHRLNRVGARERGSEGARRERGSEEGARERGSEERGRGKESPGTAPWPC